MKTAFEILARDVRSLLRNPVALLVVGALLVLPGLYAWYCIVANWDPYSHTGNVPVAIVNHDKGAKSDFAGEINIGEQVVDKLRGNDSIRWQFYDDEKQALEDTSLSICWATIVFPEDLSSRVVGIFEGSKDPPTINYYPNEKYNAVATKVTDSAAQTLVREINQEFSSTVNETLLERAQDFADKAEQQADDANDTALGEIASAQEDLERVIAALDDAQGSIAGWRDAAAGAQGALSGVSEQLPVIRDALAAGSADVTKLRKKTNEFSGIFAQSLIDSSASLASFAGSASASLGTASSDVSALSGSLNATIAELETIANSLFSSELTADIRDKIDSALDKLRNANATIAEATERASNTASRVSERTDDISAKTGNASATFTNYVMPTLASGADDLSSALSELSGAIGQFEPQIGEVQDVLAQSDSALERASESVDDAKALLSEIAANLNSTATDLGTIGSALQVDRLAKLLDIDPSNLGTFVSTPVHMTTEKIFPVANYGTAVAPFYTNLALWIGCFILASLIKLEVGGERFRRASDSQRYFGRWLLFVILSLIQSQVICGVDILLGIDCANPALFMLAGAFCSFMYMNLIFALVITFRNVGKALCILLLIMQVPGSSGMYPIEMMPTFFQGVHPLLPFTYGIDAMREALCGMRGLEYYNDLGTLLVLAALALALGLGLRPLLMNLIQMFDSEMARTGFFVGEEHGRRRDSARIMGLVHMIADNAGWRDVIEERAWAFNRRYPKLRRVGSVAILAIPFVFLIVVLPFNLMFDLDVNTKLSAFLTMLITLLVVFFALVILEYAHHSIAEETRLLGFALMAGEPLLDSAGADAVETGQGGSDGDGAVGAGDADDAGAVGAGDADDASAVDEVGAGDGDDSSDADTVQASAEPASFGEAVSAAAVEAEPVSSETSESSGSNDLLEDNVCEAESASPGENDREDELDDETGTAGEDDTSVTDEDETSPLVIDVPKPTPKLKRIGVARDIFLTDLRLGFQSIVGVVVITLLVVTPAMYAWLNIAGSWDPYGKTSGLKVAVANEDRGYKGDLVPVTVNVGDTIVSQLRGNASFDWTFVGKEEAVSGVENSAYYAAIVIPEDFSRNMMTYLTENADYPDVTYYTNEKENPIAPIITQKGATSIQESIRTAFTQRIDEVGLTLASDLVDYITQPRVSGYALKTAGHIDDATRDMKSGSGQLKSISDQMITVSDIVRATDTALQGIAASAQVAKGALGTAENGASSASDALATASGALEELLSGSDGSIGDLQADVDGALEALQNRAADVPGVLDTVAGEVQDWIALLQDLRNDLVEGGSEDVAGLDSIINALSDLNAALVQASANSSQAPDSIGQARTKLADLASDAESGIANARAYYNDNVKAEAGNMRDTMSVVSDSAHAIMEGLDGAIGGLSDSTSGLSGQLDSLSEGLAKSSKKLARASDKLKGTKDRLQQALESGDVKQVEDVLLGNDMTFMSERLAQPINENREAMYPVRNFGSSMAPFYTVLSLWVGALVMISTMRVHVVEERMEELRRRYVKVRPRHEFFGRYAIFGVVSLLQSALVLLGDLLFLQIQCVNPVAFFLLGLFVGQVFCLIVFTFTELLGDVGKALCVILLIMQVAASGGTFPVDMLDPLLLEIAPFLPFYHAMTLLQECVAGINVGMVGVSAAILIGYVIVMLLIGIVVRKPFRIVNDFIEAQLEKTGYM